MPGRPAAGSQARGAGTAGLVHGTGDSKEEWKSQAGRKRKNGTEGHRACCALPGNMLGLTSCAKACPRCDARYSTVG